MPRRKTKILSHSYLRYHFDDLMKRMRSFRGSAPPELQPALSLLMICHDAPDLFLDSSLDAQNLRLDLARLILNYPEFAIKVLGLVFENPRIPKSASAVVREFLMTHDTIDLPDEGKRIFMVGATDDEIARAVQNECKRRNISVGDVSKSMVKQERHRLERKYGPKVAEYVDFFAKLTQGTEVLYPKGQRKKARQEQRKLATDSFYKPEKLTDTSARKKPASSKCNSAPG
jgi:hypothetical protein